MGCITARKKGNRTYCVYQESHRVKLDREVDGKNRGSGQSAVKTRAVYLGSAEKILKLFQDSKIPQTVSVRSFGLVAAAYQTAREIHLPEIMMKHLPGDRGGIARWICFLVTILNRLDQATSKNRMAQWLTKTILPDVLGIDPHKLTGKNFWYAADDILSEKLLKEKRAAGSTSDDPFSGLTEDCFNRIEADLFASVDRLMDLSPSVIFYDTRNFYTYIEEPKRSELAGTCHSKDSNNAATKRKQEHTLLRNIANLKREVQAKWSAYKKQPVCVPKGIATLVQKSEYGSCLSVSVRDGQIHVEENQEEIGARCVRFGKSIVFSNILDAETGYLIDTYHEKVIIEDDFQLQKDHDLIGFRPIRHWTDTKIRAYAFCCVIALTLLRVMQWKVEQSGYKMSPQTPQGGALGHSGSHHAVQGDRGSEKDHRPQPGARQALGGVATRPDREPAVTTVTRCGSNVISAG